MREPPPGRNVDPATLSLAELIVLHEQLGDWLDEALAAPLAEAPSDALYDAVHTALVRMSRERVLRQQGELRGRA